MDGQRHDAGCDLLAAAQVAEEVVAKIRTGW
jgi:hypothetical protein